MDKMKERARKNGFSWCKFIHNDVIINTIRKKIEFHGLDSSFINEEKYKEEHSLYSYMIVFRTVGGLIIKDATQVTKTFNIKQKDGVAVEVWLQGKKLWLESKEKAKTTVKFNENIEVEEMLKSEELRQRAIKQLMPEYEMMVLFDETGAEQQLKKRVKTQVREEQNQVKQNQELITWMEAFAIDVMETYAEQCRGRKNELNSKGDVKNGKSAVL